MKWGIFLKNMKIAKVIPVYKNGLAESINIVLFPSCLCSQTFMKKCLYNRLLPFLTQCNIISDRQYGFRSGRSTSSALVDLIHKVCNAFDKKKILFGLSLDLSKAFDTALDHSILLNKLDYHGIRGVLLELFSIYVTDRKQYVSVDNHISLI